MNLGIKDVEFRKKKRVLKKTGIKINQKLEFANETKKRGTRKHREINDVESNPQHLNYCTLVPPLKSELIKSMYYETKDTNILVLTAYGKTVYLYKNLRV